jgi:hypothetical protein
MTIYKVEETAHSTNPTPQWREEAKVQTQDNPNGSDDRLAFLSIGQQ